MRRSNLRRLATGGLLLAALFVMLGLRALSPAAAAPRPSSPGSMQTMPETPTTPASPAPAANPNAAQIQQLQTQIQSMKNDLHSQLDPLNAQIKALHDKYDSQIASLEQQRKDLVEQGKPSAIQALDAQEEADLAALSDREKTDVDKLRASYSDQRKTIQESYRVKRGELKTAKN